MKIIRGKRTVVTGAASGIGRAIALAMAKEGANLFLIDIDGENLAAAGLAARDHGVEVLTAVCDLAEPAQISETVANLRNAWGELDILVNNAGIGFFGSTQLMTDAQWRRIIAVNLLAPIQLVRELFPLLVESEGAHILNVCSILGLVPWRRAAAYQTTKFAMVGFTTALRAEYCRDRFGVTALCPGLVRSSLLDEREAALPGARLRVPTWLYTTPEKIAASAVSAIRRNRYVVVTPLIWKVTWWLTRLCPGLVNWLLRDGWRRKGKIVP
jgi:3-oxoacyl-[acyl-carrier protein] reductase